MTTATNQNLEIDAQTSPETTNFEVESENIISNTRSRYIKVSFQESFLWRILEIFDKNNPDELTKKVNEARFEAREDYQYSEEDFEEAA